MLSRAARVRVASSIPLVVAFICAGCGTDSGAAASTVRVTATDTACTLDTASVPAGTVRFVVENNGSIVTEVYLLGERDRVVDEVENVDPGQKGEFEATPGGGRHVVNCKPGQIGDGIRTDLDVTGELSSAQVEEADPATARGLDGFTMALALHDDGFADQLADLAVVKGQVVTFQLSNAGSVSHALAVLAPDGVTTLAQSEPIAPGATTTLAVPFAQTGTHTGVDPLDDHRSRGLEATFRVID